VGLRRKPVFTGLGLLARWAAWARLASICTCWPIRACPAASIRWKPVNKLPATYLPFLFRADGLCEDAARRCSACRSRSGPSCGCRHAGTGLGLAAAAVIRERTRYAPASAWPRHRQALLDPLDNRILLCHALGLSASPDHPIRAHAERRGSGTLRRAGAAPPAGEPIAYIVGQREFFGLPFEVSSAVLIPAPIRNCWWNWRERLPPQGRVLDMGTGSGAIAVALAHTPPDAAVTALDVSAEALGGGRNAAHNIATSPFAATGLPRWRTSRARPDRLQPAVYRQRRPPSGRRRPALRTERRPDRFADGLTALRTIIAGAPAPAWGCWLLLEHGYDQAEAVRACLTQHGYLEVQSWRICPALPRQRRPAGP
jgi:release factor glutamine methyltransferase